MLLSYIHLKTFFVFSNVVQWITYYFTSNLAHIHSIVAWELVRMIGGVGDIICILQ